MNTPSRQEIKDNLTAIAKDAGYSGSTVNFIISVMSTAYYETLVRSVGILREGNTETAANINSLISIAAKRMYSVFRGKNPRLVLKGLSTAYKTITRGTKVYSGNDFNLYVAEDTTMESNTDVEIPLIASPEFILLSKRNKSDRYYVEFLVKDLSEDMYLYVQTDQTEFLNDDIGDLVTPTKVFREHISKDPSYDNILDMTITDFSVRYYRRIKNDANFTISAFKYLEDKDQELQELISQAMADKDDDPDAELDITLDISDFKPSSIELSSKTLPRETKEEIKINFNNQIDSIYLIRSNSDLLDSFRLAFTSKIYQVNLQNYVEYNPSELPENFDINHVPRSITTEVVPPFIVFFYVPKDEDNLITSIEMENYIDAVKYYYMFDNLYAIPGKARKLTLSIHLDATNMDIVETAISQIISDYTYQFAKTIKKSTLLTRIAKIDKVNEVVSIEMRTDDGVDVEFDEVGYITSTGELAGGIPFMRTSLIQVNHGDIIKFSVAFPAGADAFLALAAYDSNGAKVEGIKSAPSIEDRTYIVPEGVSGIRLCSGNPKYIASLPLNPTVYRSNVEVEELTCGTFEYLDIKTLITSE